MKYPNIVCHLSPVASRLSHLTDTLCSFTCYKSPRRFGYATVEGLVINTKKKRPNFKRQSTLGCQLSNLRNSIFTRSFYSTPLNSYIKGTFHKQTVGHLNFQTGRFVPQPRPSIFSIVLQCEQYHPDSLPQNTAQQMCTHYVNPVPFTYGKPPVTPPPIIYCPCKKCSSKCPVLCVQWSVCIVQCSVWSVYCRVTWI